MKKRFGNLVAAHRRNRNLTQQDLADATDPSISLNMIGRIETGKTGVSFATIVNLARALNVDEAEFFSSAIPNSSINSPKLMQLTAKLSKLSESDIDWIDRLISTALDRR